MLSSFEWLLVIILSSILTIYLAVLFRQAIVTLRLCLQLKRSADKDSSRPISFRKKQKQRKRLYTARYSIE